MLHALLFIFVYSPIAVSNTAIASLSHADQKQPHRVIISGRATAARCIGGIYNFQVHQTIQATQLHHQQSVRPLAYTLPAQDVLGLSVIYLGPREPYTNPNRHAAIISLEVQVLVFDIDP